MPVLGITGGIATGKSTFTESLLRSLPAARFDADRAARDLLTSDAPVRKAVVETFGADVFDNIGNLNRPHLRAIVFGSEEHRKALEAILHPAIRKQWLALAQQHRAEDTWLFVDIPLLFETGAQEHFDRTVTVACSPAAQRRRLRDQRGLEDALIEKIIGAQLPLATKIKQADHVIWNDSTVPCLDGQAGLLAGFLRSHFRS